MAHTKAQKTVSGNRDSAPKMLGVKIFGGQKVRPGNVIIRQRGTKVNAGDGTKLSSDYTIIALREGIVKFFLRRGEKYVSVIYAK